MDEMYVSIMWPWKLFTSSFPRPCLFLSLFWRCSFHVQTWKPDLGSGMYWLWSKIWAVASAGWSTVNIYIYLFLELPPALLWWENSKRELFSLQGVPPPPPTMLLPSLHSSTCLQMSTISSVLPTSSFSVLPRPRVPDIFNLEVCQKQTWLEDFTGPTDSLHVGWRKSGTSSCLWTLSCTKKCLTTQASALSELFICYKVVAECNCTFDFCFSDVFIVALRYF